MDKHKPSKRAIILGATGLTGGILLEKLIQSKRYAEIKLISRRSVRSTSKVVSEHLGDLLNLESFDPVFDGVKEVFVCIGTTKAKTKDQFKYRAIDFGIPVSAAALAKKHQVSTFIVVSAIDANPESKLFYNKTKGEMEAAVLNADIPKTHILRPSLIVGERPESRLGEKVGTIVMKMLNGLMFGKYKKYRSIKAESISEAMHRLPELNYPNQILESNEIQAIADNNF